VRGARARESVCVCVLGGSRARRRRRRRRRAAAAPPHWRHRAASGRPGLCKLVLAPTGRRFIPPGAAPSCSPRRMAGRAGGLPRLPRRAARFERGALHLHECKEEAGAVKRPPPGGRRRPSTAAWHPGRPAAGRRRREERRQLLLQPGAWPAAGAACRACPPAGRARRDRSQRQACGGRGSGAACAPPPGQPGAGGTAGVLQISLGVAGGEAATSNSPTSNMFASIFQTPQADRLPSCPAPSPPPRTPSRSLLPTFAPPQPTSRRNASRVASFRGPSVASQALPQPVECAPLAAPRG
jgi:hypothetical protein